MKEAVFEGKDRMVQDWGRVMVAILRANSGYSDIVYKRDDENNVIGLTAELDVGLENAMQDADIIDHEKAIEEATRQMSKVVTESGEFTPKQRLLVDWVSMKNSILRAKSGEMKISIRRNKFGSLTVGLTAELDLDFYGPTEPIFNDEEKELIDKAKDVDN